MQFVSCFLTYFITSIYFPLSLKKKVLGQLNFLKIITILLGSLPGSSVVKNLPVKIGDTGANPGLGISPGVGNGNPLHYSCLGNPMDRGT